MAFLKPHFGFDAFVSYSHGVPPGETNAPLRDWTLRLIENLEANIWVDPEFDALRIWRDKQIDPTMHLTDELRATVEKSAILMIVMSPRYLASTWCKDELEWFKQQVQDKAGRKGCVFVIRALSTDEKAWPDFLRDVRGHALIGFKFYEKALTMPYGWMGAGENSVHYVRELERLRMTLVRRLWELRNSLVPIKPEAPPTLSPTTGPQRIYLHGRPEYAPVYDEVKSVLEQDGIDVLGSISNPEPDLGALTRDSRERMEAARRCKALALVRPDADERFVGDLIDIGDECQRIERRCAVLDRSGEMFPNKVAGYAARRGIERFDLANGNWRSQFHGWLNQ